MSALAGFLNLDSAPADPRIVGAQLTRLKARGPDGSGVFTDGPVALGHALLSITPESVAETSPWRSADGQRVIAFDGRLDHREDLCAALGVTHSERNVPDPELILRAHEKWGAECVARLEGEFAFALWNHRQQELFCAGDAFARREFYYHCSGTRFAFASAIRGVLTVPGVPRELDELALASLLGGLPNPEGRTLYAGIIRLLGGRTLTVRPGGQPQLHQYWRITMEPEILLATPEDYVGMLRELVERALRSAMRTHHPVAVTLSGGLDSTGLACLAARDLAPQGRRLITLSNVLPKDYQGSGWRYEESRYILDALARYPNMDPQWAYGLKFPVVEFNDTYYDRQDQPDTDTKSYRSAELVQLAEQRGARILLGGMLGEMAATCTGAGHLEQLARAGRWLELARQIRLQARARQLPATGILRGEVLRPLAPSWLSRLHDARRHGRSEVAGELPAKLPIHADFAARMNLMERRRAAGKASKPDQDARRSRLWKTNSGRPVSGNDWVAHHAPGLEAPQPLVDRRLWEWCHRVPVGEFIRDGMPRGLYRRALKDVLPESILSRTTKGRFAPDYQDRLVACLPAIEAFLVEHPKGDSVWSYVDREKVESTLKHLKHNGPGGAWDDRYQVILCQGLRLAHFITWFHDGRR